MNLAPATCRSLGDRVRRAEASVFVGRERELRYLIGLMSDPRRLPHAVSVIGPPGIGKTALLEELARQVRGGGAGTAVVIDCHEFDGSVDGFLSLLRTRTGGWPQRDVDAPHLLCIDSYELLTVPRRRRLREEFLERINGPCLVVVGDRGGPGDMLSQRAGWRDCLETMSLGPLDESDARRLLADRGLDDRATVAEAVRLAAGHPLVLAVTADVALRCPTRPLPGWMIAETAIRLLHRRLRRETGDTRIAELLEVSSLLPVVDHDLLSDILDVDTSDLEAGYAGLSVVDSVSDGYALQEPWRQLLSADLRRRRPRRHAELMARIRARRDRSATVTGAPPLGADPALHVLRPGADTPATADCADRERVKLALEALHDPRALAQRWPADRVDGDAGAASLGTHLQHRLLEIIRALSASRSPRVSQAGRVLHCHYVARTGSLELVAERLCISRATVFRRLSLGLTLVYERLVDAGFERADCA